MRSTCLFAAALLFFTLAGCGGGGSSTPQTPPLSITSGNWDFGVSSVTGTNFIIGGNVTQSGSAITGTVRVINSTCIPTTTPVPVSGSVSGQSATVTSANITNQVITATLSGSATTLNGNYNVTGTGCAGGDHGTLAGVLVPSISGTWSGTFISNAAGNPQVGVTAPITEGSADATGIFALTGTVAFSGSPCFSTGTLANGSASAGRLSDVIIKNNDGSTTEFIGSLTTPATPKQMVGTYTVTGGVCNGDTGNGTLTKQ